jgi:hypothetical protein
MRRSCGTPSIKSPGFDGHAISRVAALAIGFLDLTYIG